MKLFFDFLRTGKRGGFAVIFALALLPMIGFAAMAVDHANALMVRSELQSAADAGALAGAAMTDVSDDERKVEVGHFLAANFAGVFESSSVEIAYGRIQVELTQSVPTFLMHVFNHHSMHPQVLSEALIPQTIETEIALVLDYSGSMNRDGKYQTMRDSAIDLINELWSNANGNTDGRLKIGLVPFSEYVYTDIQTDYVRDVHRSYFGATVRACLDSRRHPHAIRSRTPRPAVNDSRWPAPGMPEELTQPGASLPNGDDLNETISAALCTAPARRGGDDDDDDEDEGGGPQRVDDYCQRTYNRREQTAQQGEIVISDFASVDSQCEYYRDRHVRVVPLTDDPAPLIEQLRIMQPIRLTNIALGLEKGWHLLTSNAPYSEGEAPHDDLVKAIVLLTDGRQTVGGFGRNGRFGIRQANRNTERLCNAIRGDGIVVITVAFDLDDAGTRNRLRDCASAPEYFFEAETNSDLVTAFEDITAVFQSQVRLTR